MESSFSQGPAPPRRKAGFLGTVGLAALLILSISASTGGAAPEGNPPDLASRLRAVLLGNPGTRILCPGCPSEPAIRVDPLSGQAIEVPLPYERVNDLAPFPGGERILAATSSEKGRRSQLLVLSNQSLAPLGRVEIPGNGERLVVSPDGYTAYVISHRPAKGNEVDAETGEWELLAVDLGGSTVAASYPLAGAAYDLALTEDGGRIFLGLEGKIQTFTTSPLTASWFFRSPGKNRRLSLRPRQGHLYSLRDFELAIFPPEPKKPKEGEVASNTDDASAILKPPAHVVRLGFSPDGRFAVAAGRAMDVLVVVDAVLARIAGTWPEDSAAVTALLRDADDAERPRGPRGRLVAQGSGFSPPLGALAPPGGSPSAAPDQMPLQEKVAPVTPGPSPPASDAKASAPGMADPGSQDPSVIEKPLIVPGPSSPTPAREIAPEVASLEEVAGDFLRGRITGDITQVAQVFVYGPNSLTALWEQVSPSSDGTYAFKLPPKGRYRIILTGRSGTTLVTRPPYQTLEVGEYGFSGIDFKVVAAISP